MMQRSTQKHIGYQKSFERAFSTKPEQGAMEVENSTFPSLVNSDSVTSTHWQKKEQRKNKTQAKLKQTTLRDTHLKPVVLRGSNGVNIDKNPRVHLPPININLQVRELLSRDKINERRSKQEKSSLDISEMPTMLKPRRNEQFLSMKEFDILPPIGKHKHAFGCSSGIEKHSNLRLCKVSDTDGDGETYDLGEALQKIGRKPVQSPTGFFRATNDLITKVNDEDGMNDLKIQNIVHLDSDGEQIMEKEVTLDDIRKKKKTTIKLPKLPSEMTLELRRKGKSAYRTHDTEKEYETDMIDWYRARGRRFAICQEIDILYKDLAIVVKHNLLIQHLEEICMF